MVMESVNPVFEAEPGSTRTRTAPEPEPEPVARVAAPSFSPKGMWRWVKEQRRFRRELANHDVRRLLCQ